MTESVYLAIGSNIEAHTHVIRAIQMLRDKFGAIRLSPIFRTPAEGFVGDAFLNLVVQFSTRLTLTELLAVLREFERRGGRRRENETALGARTLDLDLLLYGDLSGEHSGVVLPRPEIFERRFVWQPLAEMMMEQSPKNEVEEDVRTRVIAFWDERSAAPEGFERAQIPNIQ